ncbi:bifunctional endoribonuclease/protein kinase ire1 [Puttea exsequens]|nr:bifunctional endoribonuclease/protein kinase ire1 [Puttea exsequens]
MRRRPGAAKTAIAALTASFLLWPCLVSSQQHGQQHHGKSPHEQAALINTVTRAAASSGLNEDGRIETDKHSHFKDTNSNQQRESAVATNPLALAGENRAVRAIQPARGSGKSAGLSTPLQARSLQDWEVEDFVLLATVDGSIHARDRKTGAARWELEVEKPMVETTYHYQNKSLLDQGKPEYDYLWIVEPSRDGDIYIYNQGAPGGLQRMHLTVKQLVADMSPFESVDPAVVYNGEKKTMLYTVDATTGKIEKVFGSGSSFSKEPRCPKPGGLETLDDEECGSRGTFVLGRTEYTITIQNRNTADPICTLVYSEWTPNTRDGDLHSQYLSTMDDKYVYPLHDGSILGLDRGQMEDRQRSYTQKLSSPVVRVFDVARPSNTDDPDPQLIVLPQPTSPDDNSNIYDPLKNRIFINHTEAGGWFAMSESTYPFVTGKAKAAQCYDKDWLEMTSSIQSLSLTQRQEGFVGVHALSDFETRRHSGIPTISGPDEMSNNDSPVDVYDAQSVLPSIPIVSNSLILSTAAMYSGDVVVSFILLFALIVVYVNRRLLASSLRKYLQFRQPIPSVQERMASLPSTPVTATPSYSREKLLDLDNPADEAIQQPRDEITIARSRSNTMLEPPPAVLRSRTNTMESRGRPSIDHDAKGVRIQEPSPGPDEVDEMGSPQPGKKKARRGKRGGAKRSKNRSDSTIEAKVDNEEPVEEPKEEAQEQPVPLEAVKNSPSIIGAVEIFGPIIKIGHLSVDTEAILGHGGHGTIVFKGSFGGRDVAVKRMLKQFYDIASHEVNLLQESDDHPNVIRYYDKEIAGDFLYIALELCPASLQDVVEKPKCYPSLIPANGLDTPNMLKQITSGLLYLHTLKIVHRDIKPQNILLSAPKLSLTNPTTTQPPRLLISDFGLCKKLEGDQNSFRATTAFAAGTSGWRAPELLVDDDPSLPPRSAPLDLTRTDTTNNSEPLVVDPQTNRRATRAIDIFSLGCVFYYCLTQGSHPFDKDGKFMREANIVKGHYDLKGLDCMGDYQWEAKDLVGAMLSKNPKERPDAAAILTHPFFWSAEDRLEFLCHVSDAFEAEKYRETSEDYYSQPLDELESRASVIIPPARDGHIHGDFLAQLPAGFKDTLGKQRKYKGDSVLDLLRALRNKRNHYEDMPEAVRARVGPLPAGYLAFWTTRFPNLLLSCWGIVRMVKWEDKDRFRRYYEG